MLSVIVILEFRCSLEPLVANLASVFFFDSGTTALFLGIEVSPSQHFLAGITQIKLKKMVELQLLPDLHLGLQNQGPFQGHPPPPPLLWVVL